VAAPEAEGPVEIGSNEPNPIDQTGGASAGEGSDEEEPESSTEEEITGERIWGTERSRAEIT
jgi:hypothetical protein